MYMFFVLLPRKTRVKVRVEPLRDVCVQSDVQRVRVVKHLQVFGGWDGSCRKGAVPALVARYFVVSCAAEEAWDRRGDEPQRVAEPVECPDDCVLANVTSGRREHPSGLLRVRTP